MNKKEMLASVVCCKPMHGFLKRAVRNNTVRILAYHRIFNILESEYPFDEELISASVEQFEQQMKHVSENYNVLTFHDISQLELEGRELPENPLVITFDDGYADNYLNAFPVLKKNNLKAVFYVSTDYLESSNPFWFEQLVYCGKKNLFNFDDLCTVLPEGVSDAMDSQVEYARQLRWYLMNIANRERLKVMSLIELFASESLTNHELDMVKTMTWDNLREMSDAGMEIGSHTKSHLILTYASTDEFNSEILDSKLIIESRINKNVVSISYPVGNQNFKLTGSQMKIVEKAGYHWGISYVSGCDKDIIFSRYSLKRLKVERYTTFNSFRAKLMIPDLFK